MKTIGIRDAKQAFSACMDRAQKEDLLIVKHGRPVALVLGVEGMDLEDIYWGADESLLSDIEERRRRSKTVSHEEARRRMGLGRR